MIGDVRGVDSLSDDKIKEINEALLCRSYEEFQEKFAPCIYSFSPRSRRVLMSSMARGSMARTLL